MKWWNKPVTINFLLKLLICMNIIYWVLWYYLAKMSDYKNEETLQYYEYLEKQIETQNKLLDRQNELIKMYKNNQ